MKKYLLIFVLTLATFASAMAKGGVEFRDGALDDMVAEAAAEEKYLFVELFATWCGPCRMLMPVLDELAKEYAGKVDIYKVNVEDEQQLAEEFGIRSIPTLLFIPKQGLPQTRLGAMQKSQLREVFDRMAQ